MRKGDMVARILGVVVFIAGVALMAVSFSMAYGWFNTPSAGLSVGSTPSAQDGASALTPATQLGASALQLVAKLGLLLIMTIIGSLFAGRGVQIYFAASGHSPKAIYPDD